VAAVDNPTIADLLPRGGSEAAYQEVVAAVNAAIGDGLERHVQHYRYTIAEVRHTEHAGWEFRVSESAAPGVPAGDHWSPASPATIVRIARRETAWV
jgi:hypothetical protein